MSFKHKQELECNHCNIRIWSSWEGQYKQHICKDAGKISKSYDHDVKEYVPDYPYMAIDETAHYCRILGSNEDFVVIDV